MAFNVAKRLAFYRMFLRHFQCICRTVAMSIIPCQQDGVGLGHLIATIHSRLPILDPVYALYNISSSSKHSSVYLHTTEMNNAKDEQ